MAGLRMAGTWPAGAAEDAHRRSDSPETRKARFAPRIAPCGTLAP